MVKRVRPGRNENTVLVQTLAAMIVFLLLHIAAAPNRLAMRPCATPNWSPTTRSYAPLSRASAAH